MTSQYEEHVQDSQFADTWQAAEAEAFRKDEAVAAVADREVEHAEWVAAGCPVFEEVEAEEVDSLF